MFGQTQNHETNTKMLHHQTMTASLKYTSRATESIYMKQAIPRMHMNMRNSANCKQTASPIAMRKRIRKLKECRGDVEQAVATSRRHRKPQEPKGSLGGSGKARKLGRLKHLEAFWMVSSNIKKLKNIKNNENMKT